MYRFILGLILVFGRVAYSQEIVFAPPVALTKTVNSTDEELAPMLSPDGKTLYFIRTFHSANSGGKFAGSDIWVSRKDEEGQWMPASRMDNAWNNKRSNAVIGINADQTVIYLLNAYTNKSGISFSKFFSGQWGHPEFIPVPGVNRDDFVGFYVSAQFDVILISMKGKDTLGEEDLYISLKDSSGNWTEPRNLGPSVNTSGFEISPFLSEDKKRLYFSSNGHSGFGDADIFYSERLFDSWETWSVPKNLGEGINSPAFDAYFSISDSASVFASNRVGKSADIFQSQIIPKEKPKPIQVVAQYLSKEEVTRLVGVAPTLIFKENESDLTESHKQILSKVCSAIVGKKEYKCFLVAVKSTTSTDLEKYQKRLLATLDYMRSLGIEGSRISLGVETLDASAGQISESILFRMLKSE
jgi:WD40-like Beta Propeller Repeat